MPELNAAAPVKKSSFRLAAAAGVLGKKENPTNFGDYTNFDTSNRFFRYQQLVKSTPYASIGMKKLKTSLTKGLDFDGKSRRQVDEFRKWMKKTNLVGQVQNIAGSLFRDGTFCGVLNGNNPDTLKLQPLLMAHTTLLPEGIEHGKASKVLLQPPIKEFVVNEGSTGDVQEVTYKAQDIVYGALDEWDSIQLDIRERETCGLYGESLIDPIELSIRYLHVINQGYVEFVKKYGMGRYSYSFPILEKLLESNIIDFNVFQTEINDWMEDNKNLSQNEDLVGIVKAEAIDAKGSLDIMEFKKALETDIQLGFLQSDLSMGDSKGSTYAAGYVSEHSRMVALENLQLNLSNIINDFVNRRLVMQNKSEDSVEVIFDELSLPQMSAAEITEWYATGIITKEQALEWGGFPVLESGGE